MMLWINNAILSRRHVNFMFNTLFMYSTHFMVPYLLYNIYCDQRSLLMARALLRYAESFQAVVSIAFDPPVTAVPSHYIPQSPSS